jgi:predicted unusual protein kinase regulating ubiquinone biosynthesis (AarF/ABC1/UbiB family)
MNRDAAEALSALPAELADLGDGEPAPALRALSEDLSRRALPVGRLTRGWILGTLQARIAAGYVAAWLRGSFASEDEQRRLRNEAHLSAALRLLGGMSYLRGAVMKAGQALANYPTLVPEEFIETLGALHFEAPPMHFSLLQELLRDELGGEPEELFAEFDRRPLAAASLGQVHRARLRDGRLVAVKVQYPGIRRAIRDDFGNLAALLLPMRLRRDAAQLRVQFEDVREMVERETDYESEARFTRRAAGILTDLPGVVVPAVHERFSTGRVLTTDLLFGSHVDAFLAQRPSQERRDRAGQALLHAGLRLYYSGRFCWADPHPGNVLFLDDGRLGLIDFGSCRTFDDDEWAFLREMELAFLEGGEALEAGLRAATATEPGAALDPEHARLVRAVTEWLWEPLRRPGPFDFGSADYFPRGMALVSEMLVRRRTRAAPVNTWIQRNFLGIRALVYRLRARVDMAALHDEESRKAWPELREQRARS